MYEKSLLLALDMPTLPEILNSSLCEKPDVCIPSPPTVLEV